MSGKAEIARELFCAGANCAQAVFGAFAEECGLTQEEAFRMASGFGGGMARQREVCGAVSGMVLVINCLYGNADITDKDAKDTHYARVQKLCNAFRQEIGSIVCRELLGLAPGQTDQPRSEERTGEYYRKRPCAELVALAAELLEAALAGK